MSDLLRRVFAPKPTDRLESGDSPLDATQPNPTTSDVLIRLEQQLTTQLAAINETAAALEKYLARFTKEQFRANTLAESAVADAHVAVNVARTAMERLTVEERPSQLKVPAATNTRLLESLMPILDGIEAGLESGENELELLPDAATRAMLSGWLEGQRLLRERLLSIFDKEGIRPIQTTGRPFDPYRHVAVESVVDASRVPGTIIEERRRGYETEARVLRFAEVVVARSNQVMETDYGDS